MNRELNSEPLLGFPLEERQAILVHKYFLGIEMGRDPGLECAIRSWEARVALSWRREHLRAECQAQLEEIERHRFWLCAQRNENVSWETAAHDWVVHHAAEWRRRHEQQIASTLD